MASFAENFRAGADVVGAGLDRSLRAQQLRLQEARMRLEERQLQQQATLIMEQALASKAKREEQEMENDLKKATGENYAMRLAEFRDIMPIDQAEEAAFESATKPLALVNPKVYVDLQNAKTASARLQVQRERNASLAANAEERAAISREGLEVQRQRIEMLDQKAKDAAAQKDTLAAEKAQLERDLLKQKHENDVALTLLKLENRVDKSGRVISKEEYVTRLSGTLINSGIAKDAAQAAQQLGAVYDQQGFGKAATTGSAKAAVRITTKAQRDALPAGTRYIGPDGVERIRQ